MAYQVVEDNLHTCPTCGPFGIDLGLRYDPVTGDYQLKERGKLLGYDQPLTAIFYQNGSWAMDAIQDPQLFEDKDINKPTPLTQSLSTLLRQKTQQAHVAIGGNAGGHKLHPTAQVEQHGAEPGVNNSFPGTTPPLDPNIPIIGNLLNPPGQDLSTPTPPTAPPAANTSSTPPKFYGGNVFKGQTLKYPIDLLELQQDFLKIQQYALSAANASEVFADPAAALAGNLKPLGGRQKESRGTLYLPIPNNAADSNATAWGSDQMNNLTAGIVAMMAGDMKKGFINATTITAGINTLVQKLSGIDPSQAVAIGRLMKDYGSGVGENSEMMQQIKTSLTAAMLKQASFDVPAEQILARSGVVPNSNLELLFNNVTLREFTFSYRMSPRSEDEAIMVRKIIHFFKRGMAAKRTSGNNTENAGTFLAAPNIFQLSYQTGTNDEISGMNKFKLCALTNFAVNYSPDGQFSAYEGGQPVSYNIGMSFSELMPIYESDYGNDPTIIGH